MSSPDPEIITHALDAWRAAVGDPEAALAAARALRESAEKFERQQIAASRRAGLSWTRIGVLYGLTKQGAQQRFKKETPASSDRRTRASSRAEIRRRQDGHDVPADTLSVFGEQLDIDRDLVDAPVPAGRLIDAADQGESGQRGGAQVVDVQ